VRAAAASATFRWRLRLAPATSAAGLLAAVITAAAVHLVG
jgi:hypothetical protein